MRVAKLDENLINKRLATEIKTVDGKKLTKQGAVLSERLIARLKNIGLTAVYIQDENTNLELVETLNENKRAEIVVKLKEIFEEAGNNNYKDIQFGRFIRENLLSEIKNEPVSIPVGQIMDENDIFQHSVNVSLLSIRTAITMGLSQDKVEHIAKAALLHDIGKYLKQKDSSLKNISYEEIGFEFLKRKHSSVLVYTTVKFQNETIDGKGPYKIGKDKQHDLVKILSICNYYEELLRTTDLLPHECFEKVQALVNSKFEPEVFEAFRKSVYVYPVGLPVRLSNKEEGVVIKQNKSYPLRPIVKTDNIQYNLMEHLSLFIQEVTI